MNLDERKRLALGALVVLGLLLLAAVSRERSVKAQRLALEERLEQTSKLVDQVVKERETLVQQLKTASKRARSGRKITRPNGEVVEEWSDVEELVAEAATEARKERQAELSQLEATNLELRKKLEEATATTSKPSHRWLLGADYGLNEGRANALAGAYLGPLLFYVGNPAAAKLEPRLGAALSF